MSVASAIYAGKVVHSRRRPKAHRLTYRVFSLMLDLDELEVLDGRLRLFGYNRAAVFSFRDTDHGRGEKGGLKRWVHTHLADACMPVAASSLKVEMLCYPRMFGYVFNPLTVYFCHDRDRATPEDEKGPLVAILYEVRNTFHERHTYIIPVTAATDRSVRHACAKEMYVSPFVPMDCTYEFRIEPPKETVLVAINESDAEGPLLYAAFAGKRRDLSDAGLLRSLFAFPLMTLKIMGAIHWEAFLLWAKGNPVYRHEAARERVASSVIATPFHPPSTILPGAVDHEPR